MPIEVTHRNRRMQKRDPSANKRQVRAEVVIYLHSKVPPLYLWLLEQATIENLPNATRRPGGNRWMGNDYALTD